MHGPYRVEVSPHRPGSRYEREIVVWLRETEVATFDATKVPVELVEWVFGNLNAEVSRLDLEPVIAGAV